MKTAAFLTLVLSALCSTLVAADGDLGTALTRQYKDQVLILRHPAHGEWLKFDSSGGRLPPGEETPWTVDGAIVVDDVQVTSKTLTIKGKRRWYAFDPRRQRLLPAKTKWKDKVKIEVELGAPLRDPAEATAIIDSVFVRNEQELIAEAPEYWRPFLAKHYGHGDVVKSLEETRASEIARLQVVKLDTKIIKPPQPVFTPGPDLMDPQTRSIPDIADYTIRGVVVLDAIIDQNGKVLLPDIRRPMGLGLDEKAIAAVQKWKFKPATRNGKPVAVEMGLEIQFNIN